MQTKQLTKKHLLSLIKEAILNEKPNPPGETNPEKDTPPTTKTDDGDKNIYGPRRRYTGVSDQDFDGFLDAEEIAAGSDPRDERSTPLSIPKGGRTPGVARDVDTDDISGAPIKYQTMIDEPEQAAYAAKQSAAGAAATGGQKQTKAKGKARRRGPRFLRSYKGMQADFEDKYGKGKDGFKKFYAALKKAKKTDLLGRRGEDMQFGSRHAAAFKALQGKTDAKEKKTKKEPESRQKRGAPESAAKKARKFRSLGTGDANVVQNAQGTAINIRGYKQGVLPREAAGFIDGLLAGRDMSVTQLQRALRRKFGTDVDIYNSAVKIYLGDKRTEANKVRGPE